MKRSKYGGVYQHAGRALLERRVDWGRQRMTLGKRGRRMEARMGNVSPTVW
jgi:hypothetical protein